MISLVCYTMELHCNVKWKWCFLVVEVVFPGHGIVFPGHGSGVSWSWK